MLANIPLIPASRPVVIKNNTTATPMIRPPIKAEYGVKLRVSIVNISRL